MSQIVEEHSNRIIIIIYFVQIREQEPQPQEDRETDKVREFFLKLAGDDMEVDWMELKDILDYAMRNGMFL